jgi:hypothetical protein
MAPLDEIEFLAWLDHVNTRQQGYDHRQPIPQIEWAKNVLELAPKISGC